MSENNQENTYQVTYEPTGRTWTLRPIPKHFFLMFGQLPQNLTAKAAEAIQKGNESVFAQEITKQLSPKQAFDSVIFAREAVRYACVSPKIVLSPESEDEISPFDISEDEFNFLVKTVVSGGQSQTAAKFR